MSLDGFIAAAGHVMDRDVGRQLADFAGLDEFPCRSPVAWSHPDGSA
jgi:hypothetical protein